MLDTNTNKKITGPHTGSSAGRYAHIELDKLFGESETYSDYVDKVREWADEHITGGANALPGYFKSGQQLPNHLKKEEKQDTEKKCNKVNYNY